MGTAHRDKLTLGACALCAGLVLGVYLLFPIWAPSWIAEFRQGRSAVMLVYSASGIVMTLMMPVAGWLLTRVPAWQVIAAGAALMGGGAIAGSLTHAYVPFAAVYALFVGSGTALAGVLPCQSIAVRLFPSHVGKIGALMMVAMAAAGVVLPLVVTPLVLAAGWRMALGSIGAAVLIAIPLLAFAFMRERAAGQPEGAAGPSHSHSHSDAAGGKGIVGRAAFWIIIGGFFPMMATSTAVQANLLPILADHGVGAGDASFVLSGMAIGSALGAALFGWLVDRTDPRLALGAALGLMALSLVFYASRGGLPTVAGATMLLGLAGGGLMPLISAFAFREYGEAYAPAYGLLNSFMLPYMFAPPLVGLIRDQTGSYAGAFLGAVPLLLLSAGVIWLLRTAKAPRAASASEAREMRVAAD